jgi:hypothetical protein
MMSCTMSAAWSRPVSSPCYTKHGQRHGAVLSGRITTVAMSKSGQLSRHCTIKPNCSDMFARLAGASVTRERALKTCDPSCVPGQLDLSLFLWSTARWGCRIRDSTGALLSGGRARSHSTRGSTGAHLVREARS